MVPGERSVRVLQKEIKYSRVMGVFLWFFFSWGSRDERCKSISHGPGPHQHTFYPQKTLGFAEGRK